MVPNKMFTQSKILRSVLDMINYVSDVESIITFCTNSTGSAEGFDQTSCTRQKTTSYLVSSIKFRQKGNVKTIRVIVNQYTMEFMWN